MNNNNFVGRIDQIESIDLDHEIEQHFTSQLKKVSLKMHDFKSKYGSLLQNSLNFRFFSIFHMEFGQS